jgi:hypothetical protein
MSTETAFRMSWHTALNKRIILWRTHPLPSGVSVNSGCCYVTAATCVHARKNSTPGLCNPFLRNGLANLSRCNEHKGNNTRAMFSMWSAPRPLLCNGWVNTPQQQKDCFLRGPWREVTLITGATVQLRVQLWSVNQRATEAEESPLLRFVTRKRLVKTLQSNIHCGELLSRKDQWK